MLVKIEEDEALAKKTLECDNFETTIHMINN